MEIDFDMQKEKELKTLNIAIGQSKKGKKYSEALLCEYNNKMTRQEIEAAERHPIQRFTVTKFKKNKGKITIELKELDMEELKTRIADKLKDKIDGKALIKDALDDLPIAALNELQERAIKKKGKVKSEEGCYKLTIGGKKGKPFELMLRE